MLIERIRIKTPWDWVKDVYYKKDTPTTGAQKQLLIINLN